MRLLPLRVPVPLCKPRGTVLIDGRSRRGYGAPVPRGKIQKRNLGR